MHARLVTALALAHLVVSAHADLRDGLVLYLPLDEDEGVVAVDASPVGSAASVTGSATWMPAAGAFHGALSLSGGRDGGVAVAHDFGTLDAATIAAWVNIRDPQPARWDYLLDTRSREVDEVDGATFIGRSRGGAIRFGDLEAAADVYPRDVWAQLTITVDSREANLYVDGELVEAWEAASLNIGDRLTIGNRHTFTDALHGALDEVAIWSRPLSAIEIGELTRRPVMQPRWVAATGKAAVAWAALRARRRP